MRNMSFALTTEQLMLGNKTVTRRLGWERLQVDELIRPVRKSMGLRLGEKIEVLRPPLRVVSVQREALNMLLADYD